MVLSLLKCVHLGKLAICVYEHMCAFVCVSVVVLYVFISVTCTVLIAHWTDGRCTCVINRDLNPVFLIASTNPTNTMRPAGPSSGRRSTHVCVGTNTHWTDVLFKSRDKYQLRKGFHSLLKVVSQLLEIWIYGYMDIVNMSRMKLQLLCMIFNFHFS